MKLIISDEELSSLRIHQETFYSLLTLSSPGWYRLCSVPNHHRDRAEVRTLFAVLKLDTKPENISTLDSHSNSGIEPDIVVLVGPDVKNNGRLQILRVYTCGLNEHLNIITYPSNLINGSAFHKLGEEHSTAFNFIRLVGNTYSCRSSPDWCIGIFKMLLAFYSLFTPISNKKYVQNLQLLTEMRDRASALCQMVKPRRSDLCGCTNTVRFRVYLLQLLMNYILGLTALCVVFLYGSDVSAIVLSNTESAVGTMLSLLDWMMDVPAGLKLNYRLTVFMGKFFTYHVYLWAGYLVLVSRYCELMMRSIVIIGAVGGLSLQISLLQDLIDLLTLHLFCFYIYSCRLYSVVVHTLLSLSRLFRGLKWNSLRQRVDHAHYDVTQLFIGTLLFSMLLFLLPTVFLYYSVFTLFRLAVLALQSALSQLRQRLNYDFLLLRILAAVNSPRLNCEVRVSIDPASTEDVTLLNTDQVTAARYSKSVAVLHFPVPQKNAPVGTSILQKLAGGSVL